MRRSIIWTDEMIDFLHCHVKDMTYDDIGRMFGISGTCVRVKALEHGLSRPMFRNRVDWTEERLSYLRGHYPIDSASDIADYFGISSGVVIKKARELGLVKDPSFSKNNYRDRYVKSYVHNERRLA